MTLEFKKGLCWICSSFVKNGFQTKIHLAPLVLPLFTSVTALKDFITKQRITLRQIIINNSKKSSVSLSNMTNVSSEISFFFFCSFLFSASKEKDNGWNLVIRLHEDKKRRDRDNMLK